MSPRVMVGGGRRASASIGLHAMLGTRDLRAAANKQHRRTGPGACPQAAALLVLLRAACRPAGFKGPIIILTVRWRMGAPGHCSPTSRVSNQLNPASYPILHPTLTSWGVRARLQGPGRGVRERVLRGLPAAEAVALHVARVPGLHAAVVEAEPAPRVGALARLLPHLRARESGRVRRRSWPAQAAAQVRLSRPFSACCGAFILSK